MTTHSRWLWPVLAFVASPATAEDYRLPNGEYVGPLEIFRECDVCPEMIVLPLGSFTMGAPLDESAGIDMLWRRRPEGEPPGRRTEGPEHVVEMDLAIAIGRNEVTHDEWMACVAAGGCSHVPDPTVKLDFEEFIADGAHPVIDVSYLDI